MTAMKLSQELAQKIVQEARSALDEHFIIVDTNGYIIASSEPDRVGRFHEGAKIAMAKGHAIDIGPEDVDRLIGVKAGINMPITHEGEIIGVIGITGNPKDVRPYAELIRRLTELFIREAVQSERWNAQNRAAETFVYEWVHRDTLDDDFLERGDILGLPVSDPVLVILCEPLPTVQKPAPNYARITQIFHRLFPAPAHRIIRWSGDRFLLLINGADQQREWLERAVRQIRERCLKETGAAFAFGIAKKPRTGIIRHAFEEAKKALHAASPENPIIFYEQLSLDLLLQDVSRRSREEFLQTVLGPLKGEAEWLATLEAYLAHDLSITAAAQALHIHVNTLHYRLKRIEALTGLDLRSTEGIVTAALAVRLLNDAR